jgi:hypothetical protein
MWTGSVVWRPRTGFAHVDGDARAPMEDLDRRRGEPPIDLLVHEGMRSSGASPGSMAAALIVTEKMP